MTVKLSTEAGTERTLSKCWLSRGHAFRKSLFFSFFLKLLKCWYFLNLSKCQVHQTMLSVVRCFYLKKRASASPRGVSQNIDWLFVAQVKGFSSGKPFWVSVLSGWMGEAVSEWIKESASGDLAWETAEQRSELSCNWLQSRVTPASSLNFQFLYPSGN